MSDQRGRQRPQVRGQHAVVRGGAPPPRDRLLEIADLVAEALTNRTDEAALNRVREKVRDMTRRFPLPG